VFGLSGRQVFRDGLGPDGAQMATVSTLDRHGNLETVGDTVAFEEASNPDGRRVDSDPYGIAADEDGSMVVADAGANTVVRVAADGTVSLLATPAPRVLPEDPDYESVPTAVVRGPDGAYYMTELTGYPNFPGTARVLRFRPGMEPQVYEQGFTSLVDLMFDERGRLVVLELAKNGIYNPTEDTRTGRLVRVERDGSHTVLAEMVNPGGVAMTGPGEFYVSTNSADAGDTGTLLKIKVRG
jgi:streptogramin lyase